MAESSKGVKELEDLLEDVFPYLTVIESVAPAHFDCSNDNVLFEDICPQLPVHLLALL